MKHLIDTNILSEFCRPRPDERVVRWAESVVGFCVSVVTVEELHYGMAWKPNLRVQAWFERFLAEDCVVLAVDEAVARKAGWLRGELQRTGQTRHAADMLIAATAHLHGLTLVTRNVSDFSGCGLALLNPFDSL